MNQQAVNVLCRIEKLLNVWNPKVCVPGRVTSFTADQVDLAGEGWDLISVTTPACCAATFTTNLGAFTVPRDVCAFSLDKFECGLITELTVTVEGCDLADINVNLQYTGGPCPT